MPGPPKRKIQKDRYTRPDHRRDRENSEWNFRNLPDWIRRLQVNPIPVLLRSKEPAILLWTYRHVLNLSPLHPDVLKIQQEVDSNERTMRLLRSRPGEAEDEGHDDTPRRDLQFMAQLIRMNKILRTGVTKNHPEVKSDIVRLMEFAKEDGRYPLLYHHHAHACWLLLKLGLGGNRMLERSIFWLINRQREDGGWIHKTLIPDGVDPRKAESCIWTTAEIMQMFVLRRPMLAKVDAQKACTYLLSKVRLENPSMFMRNDRYWDKLATGLSEDSIFYGGTLKLIEILVGCRHDPYDPQLVKLIQWLRSVQLDSGLFPLEAGGLSIGDEYVTVRALKVLRQYNYLRMISDNNA